MLYRTLSYLGIFVALVSLLFFFAAIGDLIHPERTDTPTGVLIGLITFFGGTTAAGGYLFLRCRQQYQRGTIEKSERILLQMISEKEGRITPEEVALHSSLTIAEARKGLNALCEDGGGEIQLTPEGKKVYVFFGFLSETERKSARSVLDL